MLRLKTFDVCLMLTYKARGRRAKSNGPTSESIRLSIPYCPVSGKHDFSKEIKQTSFTKLPKQNNTPKLLQICM